MFKAHSQASTTRSKHFMLAGFLWLVISCPKAHAQFEYSRIDTFDGVKQNIEVASKRLIALNQADSSSEVKSFVRSIASISDPAMRPKARGAAIEYALRWDTPRRYLLLYELGIYQSEDEFPSYVAELQVILVNLIAREQYRFGYRPEADTTHGDLDASAFTDVAMAMVDCAVDRRNPSVPEKMRIHLLEDLFLLARYIPVESALSRVALGGTRSPTPHAQGGQDTWFEGTEVDPETSLIGQWIPQGQRGLLRARLWSVLERQNDNSRLRVLERRIARVEDALKKLSTRLDRELQSIREALRSLREELERAKLLPIELALLWELRPLPDFMGNPVFEEAQETGLLTAYAPRLHFDKSEFPHTLEAPIWPSEFVKDAKDLLMRQGRAPVAGFSNSADRVQFLLNYNGDTSALMLDSRGENDGKTTRHGPNGDKLAWAREGIANGKGSFGLVQTLGSSLLSLQYYAFFAFNNASNGDYHHEGDWLCIEIIIPRGDAAFRPPIAAMFVHNHGPVVKVAPRAMTPPDPLVLRKIIYLETGSNEPWPLPGDSSDVHSGVAGLERRGEVGPWDLGAALGGVRPHNGTLTQQDAFYTYDCAKSLVNVRDPGNTEARLIRSFAGQWGDTNTGDANSPQSPIFNPKMRQRIFSN